MNNLAQPHSVLHHKHAHGWFGNNNKHAQATCSFWTYYLACNQLSCLSIQPYNFQLRWPSHSHPRTHFQTLCHLPHLQGFQPMLGGSWLFSITSISGFASTIKDGPMSCWDIWNFTNHLLAPIPDFPSNYEEVLVELSQKFVKRVIQFQPRFSFVEQFQI
jgi:hypothetical protein